MDPQKNTQLAEEVCKPGSKNSLDRCIGLVPANIPSARETGVGQVVTTPIPVRNVAPDMRGKRSIGLFEEMDNMKARSEGRQNQNPKRRRPGEKARLEVVTSFKNSEHAPAVSPESPETNLVCPLCNGLGFCDAKDLSQWTARSGRFKPSLDETITLPTEQARAAPNFLPDELPPFDARWKAIGDLDGTH